MIIVTVQSGVKFKYKGRIDMTEMPGCLKIKAEYEDEGWASLVVDIFPLEDIKSIEHRTRE